MSDDITFREETPPIPIATTFNLVDFDSSDSTSVTVTLTLRLALDEASEGLQLDASGTNVSVSDPVRNQFTQEYSLTGGSSYTEYEQVRLLQSIYCIPICIIQARYTACYCCCMTSIVTLIHELFSIKGKYC